LKHDEGVALQNADGLTYGVFAPSGTVLRQLVIQDSISIPDDAIPITKIAELSLALSSKASAADVETLSRKYDGKQDLIDENLTMGSGLFKLSTAGNSFSIQRLINGVYIDVLILQYNAALNATRVICSAELRPTSIGGLQDLTVQNTITARNVLASNLYTRSEIDEQAATFMYRLVDSGIGSEKVQGLPEALTRLTTVIEQSEYMQFLLSSLTDTVNTKTSAAELQNGLLSVNLTKLTAGTVRADFLDITGDTSANMIRAANIDTLTLTAGVVSTEHFSSNEIFSNEETLHLVYKDEPMAVRIGNSSARVGINTENMISSGLALDVNGGARFSNTLSAGSITASTITATNGAFGKFSSDRIADNGSTLYFAYGDAPFAIRFGKYSSRIGINCDNSSSSGVSLECIGAARFSGAVIASDVAAGSLSIVNPSTSNNAVTTAEIGSGLSYARFVHGHHLDSYTRGTDVGRTLYLNYYANSSIRCGNTGSKLGINCDPGNFQLDVLGTGRFSGALTASNFPSSSDARLKENVLDASLQECERIVLAVRPKTYNRIDMNGAPRIGYIAQHLDGQLSGGYRCIMGVGEDANGPLLSVDYSRLVPVLHGALLSALARIEALEKRLT
jgi:hypothetical protein